MYGEIIEDKTGLTYIFSFEDGEFEHRFDEMTDDDWEEWLDE